MRIGLALSGGGFRATLFHLGVIEYLRAKGRLSDVEVICSVSGGSVLAAHLVLNWHLYTGTPREFRQIVARLEDFASFDLRNRIARRVPFLEPLTWFNWQFTETNMLARYYHNQLYEQKKLSDLQDAVEKRGAPALYLMATNLTLHDGLCYFSNEGFFFEAAADSFAVPTGAPDVAQAVAASSAYPGLFRPLEVTSRSLNLGTNNLTPSRQYLTDGGVYDNLGISMLRSLRGPLALDTLIFSDAGGEVARLPETRFSSGFSARFKTFLRCADIWQYRINERPYLSKREFYFSIHDAVSRERAPTTDVQLMIGKIRTDFDEFSRQEFWFLRNHGFSIAEERVLSQQCALLLVPPDCPGGFPTQPSGSGPEVVIGTVGGYLRVRIFDDDGSQARDFDEQSVGHPDRLAETLKKDYEHARALAQIPWADRGRIIMAATSLLDYAFSEQRSAQDGFAEPHRPWEGPSPIPEAKFTDALRESSARKVNLMNFFRPFDWFSMMYPFTLAGILAIVLTAFLVIYWNAPHIASWAVAWNIRLAELDRNRYIPEKGNMPINDPQPVPGTGLQLNRGSARALSTIQSLSINMQECAEGLQYKAYCIEQTTPFRGPSRTVVAQIKLSSAFGEPKMAKAFLVSSNKTAAPGYREISIPETIGGWLPNLPIMIVDSPEKDEYLVLLLVIRQVSDSVLNDKNLTLEIQE